MKLTNEKLFNQIVSDLAAYGVVVSADDICITIETPHPEGMSIMHCGERSLWDYAKNVFDEMSRGDDCYDSNAAEYAYNEYITMTSIL